MLTKVISLCYNKVVLNQENKSTLKNKQCKIQTKVRLYEKCNRQLKNEVNSRIKRE